MRRGAAGPTLLRSPPTDRERAMSAEDVHTIRTAAAGRVWVLFDWDAQGWQRFVSDPEIPAIMQEAGHKARPRVAGRRGDRAIATYSPQRSSRVVVRDADRVGHPTTGGSPSWHVAVSAGWSVAGRCQCCAVADRRVHVDRGRSARRPRASSVGRAGWWRTDCVDRSPPRASAGPVGLAAVPVGWWPRFAGGGSTSVIVRMRRHGCPAYRPGRASR